MSNSEFIPVNEPLLEGNEEKYLVECIRTGWISSEGPFVKLFEERFAEYVGRKHAITVTNGTAALDAATEALGIGPGDEVIVPTFTIISCLGQICRCGAKPVLVDSDPLTWSMDVDQVESRITTRTKAIMLVHIYGLPVDIDPILTLAGKYDLKVIEDAAEAHGQTYKGEPCGSFGDISTFSFYPNKHVTTGEGGMIVCDDDDLAESCRSLRNLCFQPKQRFVHERLGWNLRMTNMQAAIGLAQLEQLDKFVSSKRRMGARYTELLADVEGLQLPLPSTAYADNNYWVYGLVVGDTLHISATEAMRKLAEKGVGSRPFFYPMHHQPVFQDMGLFESESYPVAERLGRDGFYLPSGLALRDDQIERTVSVLREILR
jgi:perosamine synthetase|tara:strand:- start:457 stop:1581 length:1125 start_codon:yes stop_codon:yes gene_type:complete